MAKKQLEPGRRQLVKDEVLFHTAGHILRRCKRNHTWLTFEIGRGETLIACGVCGRVKLGQTPPDWHEPKTPA